MIYDILKHHYTHRIKENGVATKVHPVLGGGFAVQYHATDIVIARPDGTITLNSGGWRTPTTKERINRYLPTGYTLIQDKHTWYIKQPNGADVLFQDGITLQPTEDIA